jgi:hypothetical protein
MGEARPQEEKVKSTIVKPSNGRPSGGKQRRPNKSRSWAAGLRRLTKKQKQKIYRIVVSVFLLIFVISIVGTLVAVGFHK